MAAGMNKSTAQQMQQEFARFYGTGCSIIWDLYTSAEKDAVLSKLKVLIPDHEIDSEVLNQICNNLRISDYERNRRFEEHASTVEKKNRKLMELRNQLLDAVWAQRKYCNKDLLMSIIFVLVVPEGHSSNPYGSRAYSCHPVFRIRKCLYKDNSGECCMIIVDENSRVYQNWTDYVNNNTLPKGYMVAPRRGVYTFDSADKVRLESQITPAASTAQVALRAVDTTAGVLGVSMVAIPAAALFVPVAAPLLIISAITGITTGLWSIGRSTANLVDRGIHEESINVTNRQARFSWLGIAGGVIGLGASGATQGIVSYAARGGQVSAAAKAAVNGVNIASLTMNGIGLGNGIAELIMKGVDKEQISTLDILQLSASLVLFTHSIYNFQYVSSIIKVNNVSTFDQFRNMLGQSQREIFDKFVAQARRLTNNIQYPIDIIRGTGSIPDCTYIPGVETSAGGTINIIQKIVEHAAVINPVDLKNCIYYMARTVTNLIIDQLIEIATNFLSSWGDYIQNTLKRVLPFEEVLWRAFNIVESLANGNKITIELVRRITSQVIRKLREMYEANAPKPVTAKIKCNYCRGYYSITPC